jgi:hypothetical protein
MRQPCGQLAIVGQEEQPLAVVVETPDGIHVFADAFEEIDDRLTALRIGASGDDASRLVHQDVAMTLRRTEAPAIDPDVISHRIGLDPHLPDRPAVDGDAALFDQLFSGPARGHASLRQDFLQADSLRIVHTSIV